MPCAEAANRSAASDEPPLVPGAENHHVGRLLFDEGAENCKIPSVGGCVIAIGRAADAR